MKFTSSFSLPRIVSHALARKERRRTANRKWLRFQLGVELLETRQLFAALAYDNAAQTALRDQLLNGVAQIADMGAEGTIAVFGDHATSVLQDSNRDTIVAAVDNGTSRIIAAAKTGFAEFANSTLFNSTSFYLNSLNWLSRGAGTAAVIVTDNAASQTWLVSQGFTNVTFTTNWQTNPSIVNGSAHILISRSGTPSAAQQTAATNFLNAGKSLFTGFNGWAFSGNTYSKNASSNALLRPYGLSWTDNTSFAFDGTIIRGTETGNAVLAPAVELSPSIYTANQQIEAAEGTVATFRSVPITDPQIVAIKNAVLANVSSAIPTPTSRVSNAAEMIRLRIESAVLPQLLPADLFVHRTAFSYGDIPIGTPRVTKNLTFDVSAANAQTQWLSTGLYAAPGETITVTVPASLVNQGWTVKIGSHDDDNSATTSYARMPFGVSRDEQINSTSMQLGSVYGGTIYFVKPTTSITAVYNVSVASAIEAPRFELGQTTDADWINSLRNLPAPQAELLSSGIIISMNSSAIRTLNNPTAVMTYWQNIVAVQDDLTNSPAPRTRPERIDDDLQISAGLMHSGYPIAAFGNNLANMVDSDSGDDWGFFHELGHNHQSGNWTFSTETEVTVNIMSMRSYDSIGSLPADNWDDMWSAAGRAPLIPAFISGGRLRTNPKQSLTTYAQLYEGFGWEAFRQFFRSYQTDLPANLPTTDQQERDQWVTRFSNVVGKNLGPFFTAWGFAPSTTALNAVAHLPTWSWLEATNPNPTITTPKNTAITFDLRNGFVDVIDGPITVTFNATPSSGSLVAHANGTFTYTPPANWTGRHALPYTIANTAGGVSGGTVNLDVVVQVNSGTPIDTGVRQDVPNANNSALEAILVDTSTTSNQPAQMLLQFGNLSGAGAQQIPPNVVISKATLQLEVSDGGGSMNFHRMLRPWVHIDTWNTLTSGIQIDNTDAQSTVDLSTGAVTTGIQLYDVTNAVSAWYSNPSSNFGWAIMPTSNDGVSIRSAESASPPRLLVEYFPTPTVENRQIFYNRSTSAAFGNGSGNPVSAIDLTKVALLPGQVASAANYTNYSRGLNGLVVDIKNPTNLSGINAASFQFAAWSSFPDSTPNFVPITPTVTVTTYPEVGVNGSDRVKLEFDNNAIQNSWLRVTMLADANTGLLNNDVFYFGNARFDVTPTSPFPSQQVTINAFDVNSIRSRVGLNSGIISNAFDVDRNGTVNAFDVNAVRANQGVTSLRSFTATNSSSFGLSNQLADAIYADTSWLDSFGSDKKLRWSKRF
jgi:Peptidase M60, enhancin and enhancin-like/N-terminal domain of M60-like peptidases/Cadherin-like domain